MAHTVRFSIPERELGNADIEFRVKKDGAAFGLLKVSRGAVVWSRKNQRKGVYINWVRFAQIMAREGTPEG